MQKIKLGRTSLDVSRLVLGGYPFGGVNRANDWDPWSPEGQRTAIATVHHALDRGVNYIDTAPSYGDGNSEMLIGEVMRMRRHECVLATKVGWRGLGKAETMESVHASLKRLQTDHVDILQLHGVAYSAEDYAHIVHGGPLDALLELRHQGKVRFLGATAEEAWTVKPFLANPAFDMVQIAYNLISQNAARFILEETRQANIGVVTMRTMTSGMLQRLGRFLMPEWQEAHDMYDVCLKFVLSDSRVHAPIVGMRWPKEVDQNVDIVEGFVPSFDVATLPRKTADIYHAEDTE
jgi:aryl-alcohol dehydrogenase-like predicted oxidoreductase